MGGGSHGVQKGFLARVHVRNHTGVLRGTFSCLGAEIFTPRCEMAGIPSGLANREPATEGYRPGWRRFTGNGPNKVPYAYALVYKCDVRFVAYAVGPTAGIFMIPTFFHMPVLSPVLTSHLQPIIISPFFLKKN